MMKTAAYVHIPFCEHICHYCDFNKVFLHNQPVDEYIEALFLEMERTLLVRPTPLLKTVFIGGGTPTALSAKQLDVLLKGMRRILPLEQLEEYTIEVNPDSLDDEKLSVLKEHGVNRLSIGVQTFDESLLKEIGRTHTQASIVDALERSVRAGFHNLSIDLMFGLPNQTIAQFEQTLNAALKLPITHLSSYSLQVEARTVFYNRMRQGNLVLPSEDDEVAMYELLRESMKKAGFVQYEISNFAKNGFESKHNLIYWENEEYYGFGAGAHGYVDGIRYQNHGPLPKYLKAVAAGQAPILNEHAVSRIERIEEAMFMGLRKCNGILKASFLEKYGEKVDELFEMQIPQLLQAGLLYEDDERIKLTDKGLLLGNEVFEQFIGVLADE